MAALSSTFVTGTLLCARAKGVTQHKRTLFKPTARRTVKGNARKLCGLWLCGLWLCGLCPTRLNTVDPADHQCFCCTVQGKGYELEEPEKLWEIGGSEWCALCLVCDSSLT